MSINFIHASDLANELGVSTRTLIAWRKNHGLPLQCSASRCGYFGIRSAVDAWLQANEELIELGRARLLSKLRLQSYQRTQLELGLDGGNGGGDPVDSERATRSTRKKRTSAKKRSGK